MSDDTLMRQIFMLPEPGDTLPGFLSELEIDAILGQPPSWVRQRKYRLKIWYDIASRNSNKLEAFHAPHVEQYTRSTVRMLEIEKLIAAMPPCDRYGDDTRQPRMWLNQECQRREAALKALRGAVQVGRPRN